jgi:hypothetical protein
MLLNQHASHIIHILHCLLKNESEQMKGTTSLFAVRQRTIQSSLTIFFKRKKQNDHDVSSSSSLPRRTLPCIFISLLSFNLDPLLVKQQALICLDRSINHLSNLSLSLELVNDLFQYTSSTWSIDALNCIHELILKQHIPRAFDPIVHSTLRHMIQLILILNENSTNISNRMKIIEILRTIFNLHLKRCESIDNFPWFEFLTGLVKFTFQQVHENNNKTHHVHVDNEL